MTADAPLQIDVIVDTMCPWCFLGKRRLDKALKERSDVAVDIRWRPYQLDPTIPDDGMARKDYLERKFGASGSSNTRYKPVTMAGLADDIAFDFDSIKKAPNTIDSHRLIRWAANENCQDEMVEHLFKLYFEEGADIGDKQVLLKAAEHVGMDVELVDRLLSSDADKDLIEQEIAQAREIGVQGVPTYIFANKYVLTGAQDAQVIINALDQISQEATGEQDGATAD